MKRLLAISSTLAFAIALANACGGGDDKKTTDGGGTDSPAGETGGGETGNDTGGGTDMMVTDTGGGSEGGGAACDPVAQDCAMGQRCDMFCMAGSPAPVLMCTTDSGGTGMHGDECGTMKGCAKGNTCLTTSGKSNCRQFCNEDTDCPMGKTCQAIKVTCSAGDGGTPDGGVPFDSKACTL